jgi:hypothetical protein
MTSEVLPVTRLRSEVLEGPETGNQAIFAARITGMLQAQRQVPTCGARETTGRTRRDIKI